MKKLAKWTIFPILVFVLFSGCEEPKTIYGTWYSSGEIEGDGVTLTLNYNSKFTVKENGSDEVDQGSFTYTSDKLSIHVKGDKDPIIFSYILDNDSLTIIENEFPIIFTRL